MWCDILKLIKATVTTVNYVETEEYTETEVYCNKKSVGTTEYYRSNQNGNEIKIIFEVMLIDYDEETDYVIYNNKLYNIVRTYEKDSDVIELHCSLKEGAA